VEHNPFPSGFSVLIDPTGERFAILRENELMPCSSHVSSAEESIRFFQNVLGSLTWLSKADLSMRLAEMGLSAEAIEERIATARRKMAVMTSGPTVYERLTTIGYRNDEGQEVIRRTDVRRTEGQRVFVMRCHVCGHEYGSCGIDIDIRRCPACQDGLPEVPTSDAGGG
jgi:hypothetical protein